MLLGVMVGWDGRSKRRSDREAELVGLVFSRAPGRAGGGTNYEGRGRSYADSVWGYCVVVEEMVVVMTVMIAVVLVVVLVVAVVMTIILETEQGAGEGLNSGEQGCGEGF